MTYLGFGLGAQILARASRQVQGQTSRRHIIARVTGLEPEILGPLAGVQIGRLSSADAQFVESIHTDGNGQRGDLTSNGHVSFFVNGGVNQVINIFFYQTKILTLNIINLATMHSSESRCTLGV